MQTTSGLPIRKRHRLRGFAYSSKCVYYVTICTYQKREIFGHCENDIVTLSEAGEIVQEEWVRTFQIRPCVSGERFIVMPNHIHALIALWAEPQENEVPFRRELFRIIGGFKAAATSRIRILSGDPAIVLWQRGFYDHVVRGYDDYVRIAEYIADTPRRWCARRS